MLITVLQGKKGFSLVEVMIALVVLLLVSLALMQTAMVSIDANTTNSVRDEAVRIAEELMNEARTRPFDDIDLNGAFDPDPLNMNSSTTRQLRNTPIQYNTATTVDTLNEDMKEININVAWTWKGESFNHNISTIRKR